VPGDELRGSFVVDGGYWGAAGFLRDPGGPWFDEEEVRLLASLSSLIAEGFRRALLNPAASTEEGSDGAPGLVVFDEEGNVASVSPAAARWLAELAEFPTAASAGESRVLQAVAARVRRAADDLGGPELPHGCARRHCPGAGWCWTGSGCPKRRGPGRRDDPAGSVSRDRSADRAGLRPV
jgi:hypothetical protein